MEIAGGLILVVALFWVQSRPDPEPKKIAPVDKKPVNNKTKTEITGGFNRIFASQPSINVGKLITNIIDDKDLATITDEQFLSLIKSYENKHKTAK